jgi:hypothetical protein
MGQVLTTYNESALHAALKIWAAEPGARFEVEVDGFVVDVVQASGQLVEVQTRNLGSIRSKLTLLASSHSLRLVYPIASKKWIIRRDPHGDGFLSRRRSPVRGTIYHLFHELVRFPHLLAEPNISLDVVLTEEEEYRSYGQTRRRRRWRWIADDRRLLQIVDSYHFAAPPDLAALIPASLPESFTTADLAAALNQNRSLAQKMAYCLRKIGLLVASGKAGNAVLYRRSTS